jgi:hypothetical protein
MVANTLRKAAAPTTPNSLRDFCFQHLVSALLIATENCAHFS